MVDQVFVYGTLCRGEPAHGLLAGARFLGEVATAPELELHALGDYPGAIRGGTTALAGELYDVDWATLEALDAFEDHPGLFRRERVTLADGREAWIYLIARGAPERSRLGAATVIRGGSWRAHRARCPGKEQ